MNNTSKQKDIEYNINQLEKGLFLLSKDCERFLSNHESIELIESLRNLVKTLRSDLADTLR